VFKSGLQNDGELESIDIDANKPQKNSVLSRMRQGSRNRPRYHLPTQQVRAATIHLPSLPAIRFLVLRVGLGDPCWSTRPESQRW